MSIRRLRRKRSNGRRSGERRPQGQTAFGRMPRWITCASGQSARRPTPANMRSPSLPATCWRLPITCNGHLAAFAGPEVELDPQTKALIEGVELTEAELTKALERHGVRRIDALGAMFDPNFHQAVMEEENKDIAAGTVLRVFQEGYQIGEPAAAPKHGRCCARRVQAGQGRRDTAAANDDAPHRPETRSRNARDQQRL